MEAACSVVLSRIVKLKMAREYHTISDTPQNPSVLPIVLPTKSALHQERGIKKVLETQCTDVQKEGRLLRLKTSIIDGNNG